MRKVITICVLLSLMSMAVQVQAVPKYWLATSGDGLWSSGVNWWDSCDAVPSSGDVANILSGGGIGTTLTCQFNTTASVAQVNVQGMGFPGLARMDITGGTLTTGEFFVSNGGSGSGVATMSGGTINSSSYFVIGQAGGNGTLTITDGVINAQNFWVSNLADSVGKVNLNGGTINISGTISIAGQNDAGIGTCAAGNGLIDITGGKIVFTKNEDLSGYINGWANQGFITAYGGAGTVVTTRDIVTGYTTISAVIPEPATISLMIFSLCMLRRKLS